MTVLQTIHLKFSKNITINEKIKIFRNKSNIGLTRSLNLLIPKADGDIIARQDDDDTSHPNRIKSQVEKIEKGDLDFCSTRAYKTKQRKIPGFSYYLPVKILLKFKNPFIHGSLVFKEILKSVGGYDEASTILKI